MTPELKKRLILIGAVVAIMALMFAIGRYTVPTKVIERVQTQQVEHQVVVEKVDEHRLDELTAQLKLAMSQLSHLKESIHQEKHTTTRPDGTTETTETIDRNVDRTVQTTQVQTVEKQVVVTQEKVVDHVVKVETQVVVEKEKIVSAEKPNWLIGPMVGVNVRDLTLAQGLTTGPLSFGVHVDRRIAGPVFLGAWGLSSGQAGLSLSLEF